MGPQRLNSSPHGGPLPCNTFYPHSSQGTGHDSWIHYSQVKHGRKQKRTLNTPVSPWEISDTYSGLQMSAILMNTPKIKLLGISFLRIALKSQHSLAGIVLQKKQEIDLLIPEQRGTWAILNKTCCFWANTSSQVKKDSHGPQEKHSDSTVP